jgi:7,8-dihydropterin-6-yl-methyl-4-(beta-D-ribofuranosyl)aminobenzene 5'-phosphate synthase
MKLRITTLSENGVNTIGSGDLVAEWGLSMLVETDGKKILFDTGKGISAANNAEVLGIDLTKVDSIVLSHGHYDHTGGLRQVLRNMRKQVPIIAHPDVWAAKYSRREGKPDRYIGIPFQRQELESLGARFHLTTLPFALADGVVTTGEIPMTTGYEDMDPNLFVKNGDAWEPDLLQDDLAITVKTSKGLVVLLGCAHHGIINTINHAKKLTGINRVHMVIGGSHLVDTSPDRFHPTVTALEELGVERLGLCHCTSLEVLSQFAHEYGDRFFFSTTGTSVEVE